MIIASGYTVEFVGVGSKRGKYLLDIIRGQCDFSNRFALTVHVNGKYLSSVLFNIKYTPSIYCTYLSLEKKKLYIFDRSS